MTTKERIENILNTYTYQIKRGEGLLHTKAELEKTQTDVQERITENENATATIIESATYYKKSQDILYESKIGALRDLIDNALAFVFYDKNYKVDIQLEDKRGAKYLNFNLMDLDKDFTVSLKNGCGNGVRSVISAILNLFVIISRGGDLLILDEKYSYISADYIDNFFSFLNKICEDKGVRLVLITHDPRFFSYANKSYEVVDGRVVDVNRMKALEGVS